MLTTPAGFADEVPAFNPLQVLADARAPVEAPADVPQDDADFSWTTRDLSAATLSPTVVLSQDEVEAQVAEHVKSSLAAGNRPFTLPSQLLLMRTSRANPLGALAYAAATAGFARSPFASIEVRMVPENVTVVPRAPILQGGAQSDEKLVVMHQGESIENLLLVAGTARASIPAIVSAIGGSVPDGRRLKLLFTDSAVPGPAKVLARLSVYDGETPEAAVALRDDGAYVRTAGEDLHVARAQTSGSGDDDDDAGAMRLYNALYETALKQEIPTSIIDDMIRIFANDVDLQRGVAGGDSFEAFYDKGEADEVNQLLFASVTTHGETYRYYRFQSPDDGAVDYYDPNGRSSRKFLVRSPMLNFKITSGFGMRFHPILGYTRPHTGTDFAAPIGSPIFASGNGTIVQAGWSSGYGRRIEIEHANGYMTTYNHLSGFARGVTEGARRAPGTDDRVPRPVRPRDRPAPALRGAGQRPFRRPDEGEARPHQGVRRPHAGAVHEGARPDRRAPAEGAADAGDRAALIAVVVAVWTAPRASATSRLSAAGARLARPAACFRFHVSRPAVPGREKDRCVQVLVRDNNVDQALKALKKKMQREGIFREMKLRGHYEKPSEKRARERAEAVRRARKLARKKMQREGLLPMKPKPVPGAR